MWQSAPATLLLGHDEVHVWRARLDIPAHDLAMYQRSLGTDEVARVQRLHNLADQRRFVARRGILRRLISNYVATNPAEIQFAYTAYGKPWLSVPNQNGELRFSLSHTSDQMLCAISRGQEVGIDIEHIHCAFDYEQIARSLFAADEYALLCALPPEQRSRAFFRLWTCKEAYIKACGLGLSLPLNTFAIATEPDKPARLLYGHNQHGASHLSLRELLIDECHVAALVVEGSDRNLPCWQYTWSGA